MLTAFGAGAVTFMMVMYALESRGRRFVLAFACGCALSSAYGFLAATSSVEESLYLSVLIERAARNQLQAMAAYGTLKELDPALAKESHDFLLSPSIVKASFAMFARRVLRQRG